MRKSSYERINYALRPAKSAERKMLCESFRNLSVFRSVNSYRYIGFGSTFFSDFVLLHRELNLQQMISIEKDEHYRERFEFNRPYSCIEIMYGESNDVLPELQWDNICTIAWLDYDNMLYESVLNDIKFFSSKACTGSILAVTVNVHPYDYEPNAEDPRLKKLKENVGNDKVPATVTEADLRGWGLAATCRTIIENEVLETLKDRNGARPPGTKIQYHQLYNFHYSDGVKMLTVGGIFIDEGQKPQLDSCAFNNLTFIKTSTEPYLIDIPSLTYNEIRYINGQLPTEDPSTISSYGVSPADLNKYIKIYRYFPTFTESEI
ncbi:MAG: hypothetical protein KGZ63_14610 [Clostridiales bacterium]|jgi:hypothetical protein|nr:hypothetical protein [Clostridiales bacterium]